MPRYHKRRLKSQLQIWFSTQINRRSVAIYAGMFVLFALLIPIVVGWAVYSDYQKHIIHNINQIPKGYSGLVLGIDHALSAEEMTPTLQTQINAASQALNANLVDKLILSSATNSNSNQQSRTLGELAEIATQKSKNITVDYATRDVYQACSRAQTEFKLTKVVIFATFNTLTRAMYTCSALGLEVKGYVTDMQISVQDNPLSAGIGMLGTIWQVNVAVPQPTAVD